MKSNALWAGVVFILLFIIALLLWLLFRSSDVAPVSMATSTATQINPAPSSNTTGTTTLAAPLSQRVTVSSPTSGATVGKTFTVTGSAPGAWYFEAVFPVQVRDQDNALIGSGQGQAQGNWTTDALVAFIATTTVTTDYTGPATLVLMKDNPSGLPENDDSVSIPIVIQ